MDSCLSEVPGWDLESSAWLEAKDRESTEGVPGQPVLHRETNQLTNQQTKDMDLHVQKSVI